MRKSIKMAEFHSVEKLLKLSLKAVGPIWVCQEIRDDFSFDYFIEAFNMINLYFGSLFI
jgi:hypothetical protein